MEYKLNNEGISQAVEEIRRILKEGKIEDTEIADIGSTVEDALLNYQSHFGSETSFELRNHKLLGTYNILLYVEGERFNPLAG